MDRPYSLLSLLFFLLSTTLHGGYAEWKTFPPFSALPSYHDLSSEARSCVDGVQDLNLTSCGNPEQLDPQGVVCLCGPKNFGDDNAPSYPEGGYLGVFWECCSSFQCSLDATNYLNLYCNSIDFASFKGSDDDAVTTTTVTLGETTSDPVGVGPPIYRSETWWVVLATDHITSADEISTQISNSEATTPSEATTTPQPSHSSGVNAHSQTNTPFDSTSFAGTTDPEAQSPARPTETSESNSKSSLFKTHPGPIIFGICAAVFLGIMSIFLFMKESSRINREKMHSSDTEASNSHNPSQDTSSSAPRMARIDGLGGNTEPGEVEGEERDQAEPLAHQPNWCPSPNPEPVSQLKGRNGVNKCQEGIETAGPAELAAEDTSHLRRRTAIYTQSISIEDSHRL
ncbi:hypothetical protein TWF103_010084 [Orbilia oligospora]|nr:hypothetical protein TWF103_010084 [Orbilia oligospora]